MNRVLVALPASGSGTEFRDRGIRSASELLLSYAPEIDALIDDASELLLPSAFLEGSGAERAEPRIESAAVWALDQFFQHGSTLLQELAEVRQCLHRAKAAALVVTSTLETLVPADVESVELTFAELSDRLSHLPHDVLTVVETL